MQGKQERSFSRWVEVANKLPSLTELHLGGCSLFGSFPSPSFVNFTSLAVIAINFNDFNSKFPEWLFKCQQPCIH
ncbi:hypothetical protein CK203_046018 [Vitis vinifera]|uniref:Uncharacterized protein n=1 Tax=Vitis vinifera TaxID=29760 RepID=A0A438HH01_VITVI|nr:hypothetical protein CK203_046018 [Vitis vinifera]